MRRSVGTGGWLILAVAMAVGSCGKEKASDETRPPACGLSVTNLDFGGVLIGDSRTQAVVVHNIGGGTLRVTLRSPCGEFAVEGDSTLDVAPSRSGSFRVTFSPAAEGSRSCTLVEAVGRCAEVACVGFGSATSCSVSPAHLDFGAVPMGGTADRTLTILNAGRATLSGVIYSPCSDFAVLHTAYDLAGGASTTVTVRFAPQSAGPASCTLELGDAQCANVTCEGSGVQTPQ